MKNKRLIPSLAQDLKPNSVESISTSDFFEGGEMGAGVQTVLLTFTDSKKKGIVSSLHLG